MTSIGELVVNLKVKSEKKKIDEFSGSIKNTQSTIRQLRNSFATLNFATRLVEKAFSSTINQVKQFGEIERFAKSVDVSATALREARQQAELFGVSGQGVEAALTNIESLNEAIRRGGTERTKAIQQYGKFGLEAVDSTGKAIDAQTQFNRVLERAKELPAEARRAFDRQFAGGRGLLNLTDQQLDILRLQQPSAQAEQTGKDLSEAAQAMRELKQAGAELAEALAPTVATLFKVSAFLLRSQNDFSRIVEQESGKTAKRENLSEAEQARLLAIEQRRRGKLSIPYTPETPGDFSHLRSTPISLSQGAASLASGLASMIPRSGFSNLPQTSDLLKNVSVNNNVNVNVEGGGDDGQTIGEAVEHKLNRVLGDINRDLTRMLYSNQERE